MSENIKVIRLLEVFYRNEHLIDAFTRGVKSSLAFVASFIGSVMKRERKGRLQKQ